MKRKILSLLLAITLISVSVSAVFPTILADSPTNLFENGDFASYSGSTPTGWVAQGSGSYTIGVDTANKTPDGANSVKFTSTNSGTNSAVFYNSQTIHIEKNTKYTITYYVKDKNIPGLRFYMYEPDYVNRNGTNSHNDSPAEGQNIYSYDYDNGSTRVIRMDVPSTIMIGANSYKLSASNSMAIVRNAQSTPLILTPDFPSQSGADQWVQIVHTFTTGNKDEHEADVRYAVLAPACTDGEVWLGGFTCTAEKQPIKYQPSVNDYNLGTFSPSEGIALVEGEKANLVAEPFDGNIFNGWYDGDTLVTADPVLEVTFESIQGHEYQARFTASDIAPINAGAEDYPKDKNLVHGSTTTDADWKVDSVHPITWQDISASSAKAHTGNQSIKLGSQYSFAGRNFYGLEKNTDYAISFYMWMKSGAIERAFVTPMSGRPVVEKADGTLTELSNASTLGYLGAPRSGSENWEKVYIRFNTGDNTDVTLWIKTNAAPCYVDDLAVFQPVSVSVVSGLGGDATATDGYVAVGSNLFLTATPLSGNTFGGWYDDAGNLVSSDATYRMVVQSDISLKALFEGPNMPAREELSVQGYDGTFENGTVGGWFADDPTFSDSVSWCSYTRTTDYAYEGQYALAAYARHRDSVLPLKGLEMNADYRFSFYINFPDTSSNACINSLGIADPTSTHLISAQHQLYSITGTILGGTGWHKVDIYFNSGNYTSLNFLLRFATDLTNTCVYFDNMSLYRYVANSELVNGDFEDGSAPFNGSFEVVSDNGSKVAKLAQTDALVCQAVQLEAQRKYTVSFRAKGEVMAAAIDVAQRFPTWKNMITSQSYLETADDEWQDYEFSFYSGIHTAAQLSFVSKNGEAMIDDVVLTSSNVTVGSVVEKVDFETDRFALTTANPEFYEIYTATSENDKNVYAGSKSLHFKYDPQQSGVSAALDEAFMSLQLGVGVGYRVTFQYKIADGKNGGAIYLAPEQSATYGSDIGFEQLASDNGWHQVVFSFSNSAYSLVKTVISNITELTASDFYIDDIVWEIAPPMVSETNTKISYCELLYNVIENEGFESTVTDENWKGLPSTAKIVTGDAFKGKKYLSVSNGTLYILPVEVKPGTEYYFGASVRGSAATKGYIGLATKTDLSDLSAWYCDALSVPASKVVLDNRNTNWQRSAFRFTSDTSGYVYLVIECTAGNLDVDGVMLFESDYGYRYDPNDYTVYIPYNYDAMTSTTCVINGGYGPQPYYVSADGNNNGADPETPATGDSMALPVIGLLTVVLAFGTLLVIRKRKEGGNVDAQ